MKRKVAISSETAPMIFQVRSSRARALKLMLSTLSCLNPFVTVFFGLLPDRELVVFFFLLDMAAKINGLMFGV